MSDAEYTALTAKPLHELRSLPFWQLTRYLARCGRVQREMLFQVLAG